jgi:hypothetical protein
MNKKIIYTGLLIGLLLVLGFIYLLTPKSVGYKQISKHHFSAEVTKYPFKVIYDDFENFKTILLNPKNQLLLYSDVLLKEKLDFINNDYLITFGSELEKLEYNMLFREDYDKCDYLDRIPLKADIKASDENKFNIYIYRLNKRGVYRNSCP